MKSTKLTSTFRFLLLLSLWIVLSFISSSAQEHLPVPTESISFSKDSLVSLAIQHSSLLKAQLEEIKDKQEVINREKMGWLSSFKMGIQFLNISQDYNADVTRVGVLPSLGLSIQIDFERLFTTPSNIRSATFQKNKIKQSYQVELQTLALQIQELVFDIDLALKQSEIRYKTFFTIADQLTLIEERFKRGEIEMSVYLDALNSVDQAKESYLLVYYDVLKKKAHLELITKKEDL